MAVAAAVGVVVKTAAVAMADMASAVEGMVTSMATVIPAAIIATTVTMAVAMTAALMTVAAVVVMATEMVGMAGITTTTPKPTTTHRGQQQGRHALDVHLRGMNPLRFNNQLELEVFGMIDESKP